MKLKLIECTLLAAIVVFVTGCDSDCLDFDTQFSGLGLDQHYVTCVQNPSGAYTPQETPVPLTGATGPTYAPAGAFDCGPSVNGQAPLPNPRSAAAIPPATLPGTALARPGARANRHTEASGSSAPAQYNAFGFNDGYMPRGIVNPNIPVAGTSADLSGSSSCSNAADVLIVNHLHGSVTRLGTCPFSTKATIPLVSRPLQVAVTPDGTQAVVTSFDNAVNFINLATNAVAYTLHTDQSINPSGVAIAPDGKQAYVTSFNNVNAVVLAIDMASHSVVASIPVNAWPQAVFITPDGSQAWVTYPFENEVDVIDTLTNTVSASLQITSPGGIAFNPTGTRAYIASGSNPGTLLAIDSATLKVAASYRVGSYPNDVKMTPGGRVVVVNNFNSGNLSAVDTVTGTVVTGTSNSGTTMGLVPIY